MICKHCGALITLHPQGDPAYPYAYVDQTGSTSCDQFYDDCLGCQDGEPHPHEPAEDLK